MDGKNIIRKMIREDAKIIFSEGEYKKTHSKRIAAKIINSEYFKDANNIFTFMPLNEEVDLSDVFKEAYINQKNIFLPRIKDENGIMDFYGVSILLETSEGNYGILEPDSSTTKIDVSSLNGKTIVFVPGLAFTKDGKRLGRGKGFYDRYLSELKKAIKGEVIFVGVCYPFEVLEDLPVEKNDILMDKVLF